MRDGFRIIDCDRHVMEPADLWERYLDRPFRHSPPLSQTDRPEAYARGYP